jgi:mono/diheme cytochrome c family protein
MSKRTFIVFGLTVALLAVVIPWLAFQADGEDQVPSDLTAGKELFDTNCGACHTLYAAGTDGNFGPDLDDLLAPAGTPSGSGAEDTIKSTETRVLGAIEEGVDSSTEPGRMPGGILSGEAAEEVAAFVAHTAGEG